MITSGSIFPLFAAIPGLIAAAAPAVAKAVTLGAAGALGTKAAQSIAESYEPKKGRGYKKGKGSKTTRNPTFMVQRERLKNTTNGLLIENQRFLEKPITPLSNFDLIDAAKTLAIKHFRGFFY